jgi:hypothetical protein
MRSWFPFCLHELREIALYHVKRRCSGHTLQTAPGPRGKQWAELSARKRPTIDKSKTWN